MLSSTERALTDHERASLAKSLPLRIFKSRRARAEEALNVTRVRVLDFDVLRYWDVNECTPDCCPNSWLFQVSESAFVWTESWNRFNFKEQGWPGTHIRIDYLLSTGQVLFTSSSGAILQPQYTSVRDQLCGGVPMAECAVVPRSDLPHDFVTTVLGVERT